MLRIMPTAPEPGCTPICWTGVACPTHGNTMPPRGRALPLEMSPCCEAHMSPSLNPRHLWHEHDSTRWYVDPEGWNEHARSCERDDCLPYPSDATH